MTCKVSELIKGDSVAGGKKINRNGSRNHPEKVLA